uniref:ATP synthase CF0 B' chain subunit II n=1 Tax=Dictyopteris divaricata TaxID=156996 RepID=A0A2I4Q2L6_9PHAE|nr:ATP synthase CF0 B' chain subunit II [Dictyopteris divaricata]YP_010205262.1 ATP synthase CF0 B' chain subunit II [Grateloupia livida]AQZ24966.1 ATP synthase CF0 B' chain subunit II [Dictyopteris divaricata]UAV85831.1 ATP synthase CF0 B' chain subunit II [Grateloupia livida]
MFNFNTLFLITTEKTGGLFDFDGTLIVIVFQFILLMVILPSLLYNPLLDIMDERMTYMEESLEEASTILAESNRLNSKYEKKTSRARKVVELDLLMYQKLYKDLLDDKMKSLQFFIDEFLMVTIKNSETSKEIILKSFDTQIESLTNEMMVKLLA